VLFGEVFVTLAVTLADGLSRVFHVPPHERIPGCLLLAE